MKKLFYFMLVCFASLGVQAQHHYALKSDKPGYVIMQKPGEKYVGANINNPVTIDGQKYKVWGLAPGCFKGNGKIEEIFFKEGDFDAEEVFLGAECFADCPNLMTVELANSIRTLPENCFRNDNNLQVLRLPHDLQTIGKGAFTGCSNLTTLQMYATTPKKLLNGGDLLFDGDFIVLEGLGEFYKNPSNGWTKHFKHIKEMSSGKDYVSKDPKVVATQNYEILYKLSQNGQAVVTGIKCSGIADVVLPHKFTKDGMTYKVVSFNEGAFHDCQQLRSFRVEGEGDRIYAANGIFYGCTALETCDLKGLYFDYNIGAGLFLGCTSLKEVKNLSVSAFVQCMFEGCTSLTELHIPYNCTFAQKNAFKGCDNLILYSDYKGIPKGFSADDSPCTPKGILIIPTGEDKSYYGNYDCRTQGYAKAFTKIMTKAAWENGGKEPVEEAPNLKPSVTMNSIQIDEGAKAWTSNLYRGLTVVYDLTAKDFPTDDVWVTIRFYDANGRPLEAVEYGYRDGNGNCCSMARLYRNTYNPARFSNQHLQIPYNAVWKGYGAQTFKYRVEVSGYKTGVLWKSNMKTITITNRPRPRGRFL